MDNEAEIKCDSKANVEDEEFEAQIGLKDFNNPDSSPEIYSNNAASDIIDESKETEAKLSDTECDVETITAKGNDNTEDSSKEDMEGVISVDITPEKDGGVLKKILKEGEGDEYPGYGDRVSVHYTGWRLGKEAVEFDSSRKGERFEFSLGRGMILP